MLILSLKFKPFLFLIFTEQKIINYHTFLLDRLLLTNTTKFCIPRKGLKIKFFCDHNIVLGMVEQVSIRLNLSFLSIGPPCECFHTNTVPSEVKAARCVFLGCHSNPAKDVLVSSILHGSKPSLKFQIIIRPFFGDDASKFPQWLKISGLFTGKFGLRSELKPTHSKRILENS